MVTHHMIPPTRRAHGHMTSTPLLFFRIENSCSFCVRKKSTTPARGINLLMAENQIINVNSLVTDILYPTPFEGGCYQGRVLVDESEGCCEVRFSSPRYHMPPTIFLVSGYGTMEATRQAAEDFRRQKSDEMGWTINQYRFLDAETAQMHLGGGIYTIFNTSDLENIRNYRWTCNRGYARTTRNASSRRVTKIHNVLCKDLKVVDHINGDPLDNRRCNLRDGSKGVNGYNRRLRSNNTSGYNGISCRRNTIIFNWREQGKDYSKCFGYNRYGSREAALTAALQFRDETYRRIGNFNGIRPKRQRTE